MLFSEKWLRNHPQFLLYFLIHIDVLMLCRKFELIPTSNFQVMAIFKMSEFLKNTLYYSPCFFSEKWVRNHPQFLLHFLIHIDVLMLCRKFELIPTSNFRVMAILKNGPFFEKYPVLYSPCFFPKNGSEITKIFLLHFLIHIDVLMLPYKMIYWQGINIGDWRIF